MDETLSDNPSKKFDYQSHKVVYQDDVATIYERPDGTRWRDEGYGPEDIKASAQAEKAVADVGAASSVAEQQRPSGPEIASQPVAQASVVNAEKSELSASQVQSIEAYKRAQAAKSLTERNRDLFTQGLNRWRGARAELQDRERVRLALRWATDAVCGDSDKDPLTVFPDPSRWQDWEDIVFEPNFTSEQEENFRAAMAELGAAEKNDRWLDYSRLKTLRKWQTSVLELRPLGIADYKVLLDSGHIADIVAELDLALRPRDNLPSIVMVAVSNEKVSEEDRILVAHQLGIKTDEVEGDQFGLIKQLFQSRPDFVPTNEGEEIQTPVRPSSGRPVNMIGIGSIKRANSVVRIGLLVNKPNRSAPIENQNDTIPLSDQIRMLASVQAPGEHDVNVVVATTSIKSANAKLVVDEVLKNINASMTAQVMSCGIRSQAQARGNEGWQPPLNQLAGAAYECTKLLKRS